MFCEWTVYLAGFVFQWSFFVLHSDWWSTNGSDMMLSLILWIVCFYYLLMYFELFLYLLWLCFLYLEWFLCQILSGLLFQLVCCFYHQFVYWSDVSGVMVYFLSLFISVCVVMSLLILIFSGVVFLEKLISVVGLFVCSWFCTRDPLDVMEL